MTIPDAPDFEFFTRNQVPQRPMTEAMLCEPHGMHNHAEYRQVLEACHGSVENLHFWARYGVMRTIQRFCFWGHSQLPHNVHIYYGADEVEILLTTLRVLGPLAREHKHSMPSSELMAARAQDLVALECILREDENGDDNLRYWAKIGVHLGVSGWVTILDRLASDSLALVALENLFENPRGFLSDAGELLAKYPAS